jgi:hypothetical protein
MMFGLLAYGKGRNGTIKNIILIIN